MKYSVGTQLIRKSTGAEAVVHDVFRTDKGELYTIKYPEGLFRRYYLERIEAEFIALKPAGTKTMERPLAQVYKMSNYYYNGTKLCKR